MKLYGGRARLYLTTALIVLGTVAMGSLALRFISLLEVIDKQGAKEPVEVLFGWVTLQPQTLSPLMQMIILLTFVFFGFMMGVALSGPIYNQIVRTRNRIESMSAPEIWASVLGLIAGLLITVLIFSVVPVALWLKVIVAFIVCYVCVIAFLSTKEQFNILFSGPSKEQKPADIKGVKPKLLDTNVIIDGRIADVCRAGFVEGPILIPRFVLEELQQIADSSDPLKRARGRRGLDILGQMQKEYPAQVKTMDTGNGNNGEEVDSRLVRLAQEINASVVTNDFNLNKVAGLQGVQVLNINELANALKPVVLPGEEMSVMIIKEGKEANQGIGYMDDGTMIVVEGGRRCIGDTLDVIVTSVLQTVAGKMIFANIKTEQVNEEEVLDRNIRSYSSSRQRKKIR